MKQIIMLFILLTLPLAFCSSAQAELKKGPYLQKLTKTSVTVVWETTNDAAGAVEWGADESLGNRVEAGASSMHEVSIEGLQPDTAYYYKVSSGGEETQTYEFWTAPEGNVPVRFVAYGDSRSGENDHRRVISRIMEEDPDIYSNSGDIVPTGEDEVGWQTHFNVERDIMATRLMLPAIGNHDVNGLNFEQYKKYFVLPTYADGENSDYEENYYYADWGPVRVITLDTTLAPLNLGSPQYNWLIQTLEDAKNNDYTLHVFINTHIGPYTAKAGRSGSQYLRALSPTLVEYDVRAVISGHDHHYYRATDPNGLHVIVTGGGGAGLYDCDPKPDFGVINHACEKTFNYVVFDINGKYVSATAKDSEGNVLETFEWEGLKEPKSVVTPDGDDTVPVVDGDDSIDVPDGDTSGTGEVAPYDPEYGFAGCQHTDNSLSAGLLLVALFAITLWRRRRTGAQAIRQR